MLSAFPSADILPSAIAVALPFPQIDPVLISVGPFALRWYALAYLVGILLGWVLLKRMVAMPEDKVGRAPVDAMLNASLIGIILGGRLGYVLAYDPSHYFANPAEIVMVWRGGMSFHGGFLGVILAVIYTARRYQVSILRLGDIVAVVSTIGLFLGRLANFVNGELYGRPTDMPWGVVFPNTSEARHPSQLYEAGLEGIILFAVLWFVYRRGGRDKPGLLMGIFMVGYGLARFAVEFVREPDAHIGYLAGVITMGQLLSLPMIFAGIVFIILSLRRGQRVA